MSLDQAVVGRGSMFGGDLEDVPLTVSQAALLPHGTDYEFRKMLHHLLAFAVRLQKIRDTFGTRLGLAGPEYTVLTSVAHLGHRTGVGIKEIADHLCLSATFVTTETKRLQDKGLVEKDVNPEDRRRVLVRVTSDGLDLLRKLAVLQRPINDALFASLSDASFRALSSMSADLAADSETALQLTKHLVAIR